MVVCASDEGRWCLRPTGIARFRLTIVALALELVQSGTSGVRRLSDVEGNATTLEGSTATEDASTAAVTEVDAKLSFYMVIYLAACILAFTLLFYIDFVIKAVRRRYPDAPKSKSGLLHAARWHSLARGSFGLVLVAMIMVPMQMFLTGLALGPVLATLEGWHVVTGVEYIVDIVLRLKDPLTTVKPSGFAGMTFAYAFKVWALLIVTCAKGIVSQMALVQTIAAAMPPTFCGLLRYLMLYIPVTLLLIAIGTGSIIALIEEWEFLDGVHYMAGLPCSVAPRTAEGHLVEIICIGAELALAGMMLGIIGKHPFGRWVINRIEGVPEYKDDARAHDSKQLPDLVEEECEQEAWEKEELQRQAARKEEDKQRWRQQPEVSIDVDGDRRAETAALAAESTRAETREVACQVSEPQATAGICSGAVGSSSARHADGSIGSAAGTEAMWQWLFTQVADAGEGSSARGGLPQVTAE